MDLNEGWFLSQQTPREGTFGYVSKAADYWLHIVAGIADMLKISLFQMEWLILCTSLVSTSHPLPMVLTGKALASHLDKSARLESQVKQLIQMANQQQSKLDLRPLFDTIENVKQKIALMESYDQRLGMLGLLSLFCVGLGFLLMLWWLSRGSGSADSQLRLLARNNLLILAF